MAVVNVLGVNTTKFESPGDTNWISQGLIKSGIKVWSDTYVTIGSESATSTIHLATLPAGAIALGEYNIMADFVPNTVNGLETMSTGVLRKDKAREMTYIGCWALSVTNPGCKIGGSCAVTCCACDQFEYTFFGTGFDFRFSSSS